MSTIDFRPSCLHLVASGELAARVERARHALGACRPCGHCCLVDRRKGVMGHCLSRERAVVHGFGPHPREEQCLRGEHGSGTVNLMDQQRPRHRAREFPPLDRGLTLDEWRDAELDAREAGLILL